MATTEERLAALEQKMQMLTTPPDDYYMSRWTGEQIDNAVARIVATSGTGAITPDAIGAAPAGFGLGTQGKAITDLNDATLNGWYYFGGGTLNTPTGISNSEYGSALVVSRDGNSKTQYYTASNVGTTVGYDAVRYMIGGIWQPWEYVNPPMQLGIEYRTTERYNGNPVYAKLVDCGVMPNNTVKTIGNVMPNIEDICLLVGSMRTGAGGAFLALNSEVTVNNAGPNIQITTTTDYSSWNLIVLVKYTKTTD